MLLVAVLLLAAVGLLVVALAVDQIVLAWGSVGLSAAAAVALLARAWSGRRRR